MASCWKLVCTVGGLAVGRVPVGSLGFDFVGHFSVLPFDLRDAVEQRQDSHIYPGVGYNEGVELL